MANAVSQEQFYERIQMLEDKIQSLHKSSREHIDDVATVLRSRFDAHEKEDRDVEYRVQRTEDTVERHVAALDRMGQLVYKRRITDNADEGAAWSMAFTKREGALIGLGLGIIMAMLKLLEFTAEKLWNFVKLTHP